MKTTRLKYLVLTITIIVLFAVSQLIAQNAPPTEKQLEELFKNSLNKQNRDLADEYLEILEQLQETLEDYIDYYDDLRESEQEDHVIPFKLLLNGIKKGKYAESYEILQKDIEKFVSQLKKLEREHLGGVGVSSKSCCSLVRNLRKEMIVILDLIEDHAENMQSSTNWDKSIEEYLKVAMAELVEALDQMKLEEAMNEVNLQKLKKQIERQARDKKHGIIITTPERAPKSNTPPSVVYVPYPTHEFTHKGYTHEYNEELDVRNSSYPINISIPVGSIEITGWDEDKISSTLTLVVKSDSHDDELKMIELSKLELVLENNTYVVKSILPKLKHAKSELIYSKMTVYVPEKNPVVCSNSFGKVEVLDLQSDIEIQGDHSSISMWDVEGTVSITNKSGGIELGDISGSITVANKNSPINISGCDATMIISNSYAPIHIFDSRGLLTLNNTGVIEIQEHDGDINIENSHGLVTISEINGNLDINNSYQPIIVTEISGKANLNNEHGMIKATDVGGNVIANTFGGQIIGEAILGSITMEAERGNIIIFIEDELNGRSSLKIHSGSVQLHLSEYSNLLLKASTSNGQIHSDFPFKLKTIGMVTSTEYKFGRGVNLLDIEGTDAKIIVVEK